MLTRCPKCATTFRITPEQLKAKQGRVRCGQCQTVFNAIETLAEAAPPDKELQAPDNRIETPASPNAIPEQEVAPLPPIEIAVPAAPEDASATASEPVEAVGDDETPFDTLLPDEVQPRHWPWVLGTVIALLGLSAQAAFHFRTEIAVLVPEAKPEMLDLCATLGCDLALPRKADLISIETSDLHPEPANASQLQLAANLKNRAPFAQAYPHLELTLTDTADKAVIRRTLAPADYLPKTRPTTAFAAGSDLAINLALEVKDAAPVGYRLYVFYP